MADGAVFEIDAEAWEALAGVHLGMRDAATLGEVLDDARREGILGPPEAGHDALPSWPPPLPAFPRWMNLQITHRCALRCRHCYHGPALDDGACLGTATAIQAIEEFTDLGGLGVMITGGEPLLHPGIDAILAVASRFPIRVEVCTSGVGFPPGRIAELVCHRVRISLDGMRAGHERLRGRGSFAPALRLAEAVRAAGIELAVSTMLHSANLGELEELAGLVRGRLGAVAWRLTAPFPRGAWIGNAADLGAVDSGAARALAERYGYGDRGFVSPDLDSCDAEMLTIDADGTMTRCVMAGTPGPGTRLGDGPLAELWSALVGPAETGSPCGVRPCSRPCSSS